MDGVLVHEERAIPGRERLHRSAGGAGASTPRADEQLDLHAPRPAGAAARSGSTSRRRSSGRRRSRRRTSWRRSGRRDRLRRRRGRPTTALHEVGYPLTKRDPDYVVLGETRTYSFEAITKAIRLIDDGARFIATNPDPSGPSPSGLLPATGAVITRATGHAPYFVGKPNPLMMRTALNRIDANSETTAMIGDRMDTDVISDLEAGLRTVLLLTGSTSADQIERFPYQPTRILDSIADVIPLVDELARS